MERTTDQFSKCQHCGNVAAQPVGKHNLEINIVLDDLDRLYVYDLCDECIDYIINWVESKEEDLELEPKG